MPIDLSPLLCAASRGRRSAGFPPAPVIAFPEIIERSKRVAARTIDSTPFRVLDAPGLVDDFYLNLLDWTESRVAIALGDTAYVYNTETREASEIHRSESGYISALRGHGALLFMANASGALLAFDTVKEVATPIEQNTGYAQPRTRICAVAAVGHTVASGNRSGVIVCNDLRAKSPAAVLLGHTQEVCGLQWNSEYLASGSNDNTVRVWRHGSLCSMVLRGHASAVRALDWCPWRGSLLATGGGSKDKSIRFWDVSTGRMVSSTVVASQVCAVRYLGRYKELVTAHGFQDNDIRLWKAADMRPVAAFGAHESRVLHLAVSPDECTVASLGADDTLKFWKVAEAPKRVSKRDSIGLR